MRVMTPCLSLFAALTLASAVPAVAQDVAPLTIIGERGDETFSAIVSHGDLNLTLDADRQELDRRISVAASEVCDRFKVNPSQDRLFMASCTDNAIRKAAPQVGVAVAAAKSAADLGANASAVELPR